MEKTYKANLSNMEDAFNQFKDQIQAWVKGIQENANVGQQVIVNEFAKTNPDDYSDIQKSVQLLMEDYRNRLVVPNLDDELTFVKTIDDLKQIVSRQLKEKMQLINLKYKELTYACM